MPSLLRFTGITAIMAGWATIIASIAVSPWFSITRNALSDLGVVDRPSSLVFNPGLAASAILAMVYSLYLWHRSKGRWGVSASVILFLSSWNLLLVALFPEGTYPHLMVSVQFFVFLGASILIFGIDLLKLGYRGIGLLSIILPVLGFGLSATVPWPSIGALEVFNLILATVWLIFMLLHHLRGGKV